MPASLEISAVATRLEKVSFHSNPKERQRQRMFNYRTAELISLLSKVMFKILQARLQQYISIAWKAVQKNAQTTAQLHASHLLVK